MHSMKFAFHEASGQAETEFVLDGRTVEFREGLKTADYTHTLHRFPGKFVPQVARELLRIVGGDNGAVADPFCGSGTTLVEAAVLGRPAVGADCDPLAAFISEVKVSPLSQRELVELRSYWNDVLRGNVVEGVAPAVANLSHWFSDRAVAELSWLKTAATNLPNGKMRAFSLVVFSSIIRRVSNADDQTQKTYVSHTLKKTAPAPSDLFPTMLDRALRGLASFSAACKARPIVYRADARHMDFAAERFSGVVTSPPYIDSIDYVYNQMLEYYWLWDVVGLRTIDEVKTLRRQPMGFSKPALDFAAFRTASPCAASELNGVLPFIAERSAAEGENVLSYFIDFRKHLDAARGVLRRKAIYGLVVGESMIRSVIVPTPKILTALFRDAGFEFIGSCSYAIKRHYMKFPRRANSGKIMLDHVLCFRTP
jgi:hypothetical protein